MAFGGEVDDAVDMVFCDYAAHFVEIGYIGLDKAVVRTVFDILEVCEVAGIGKFVKVDNVVVRIFVDEKPDHVRSDESGSAGDEYVTLHCFSDF